MFKKEVIRSLVRQQLKSIRELFQPTIQIKFFWTITNPVGYRNRYPILFGYTNFIRLYDFSWYQVSTQNQIRLYVYTKIDIYFYIQVSTINFWKIEYNWIIIYYIFLLWFFYDDLLIQPKPTRSSLSSV